MTMTFRQACTALLLMFVTLPGVLQAQEIMNVGCDDGEKAKRIRELALALEQNNFKIDFLNGDREVLIQQVFEYSKKIKTTKAKKEELERDRANLMNQFPPNLNEIERLRQEIYKLKWQIVGWQDSVDFWGRDIGRINQQMEDLMRLNDAIEAEIRRLERVEVACENVFPTIGAPMGGIILH